MAGLQPPARSWFRLASLARMAAEEASGAAAATGTATNLPRPTTPPLSRIPVGRPQQQPTLQPQQQQTSPTPPPQQQNTQLLPQQPTPTQPPPQQTTLPQQTIPPQQQSTPSQQRELPTLPQQQEPPPPLQQQEPIPAQQQPTSPLQQESFPAPQQQTTPLQQQDPISLPQQQLTPSQQQATLRKLEPIPAPQQPTSPLKQPPVPQQPTPQTSQQPTVPQTELTLPPFPLPPRFQILPPQAEAQLAFKALPTAQIGTQTVKFATEEAQPSPDNHQPPAPPQRATTPPVSPKVIRTSETPPPDLMAGRRTTPVQQTESIVDAGPEIKPPPRLHHATVISAPEEKTTLGLQQVQFPHPDPENKQPSSPHLKTFSVAPEEKTVPSPGVQPPPTPEPEPETKPPPPSQPNASSSVSDKKMSNSATYNKPQGPPTETKEDRRIRVITMAGENTGAVMELDSAPSHRLGHRQEANKVQEHGNGHGRLVEQEYAFKEKKSKTPAKKKRLAAVVNSNVQGINNSVVFNSSCTQLSPGIHITFARTRHPKVTAASSSHKGNHPHMTHHH